MRRVLRETRAAALVRSLMIVPCRYTPAGPQPCGGRISIEDFHVRCANVLPTTTHILEERLNQVRVKIFVLLLFGLAVELVFFKFVPDLGTATLSTQGPSLLADFNAFQAYYQTPGSVMYSRFAGTSILLHLARLIGKHVHSTDVRLYPLRIAAGILTPLYAFVGLIPVMACRTRYRWETYAALYCSYCVLSLYVFYPYDMPSIALISVAAFLILEERLGPALLVLLVTGVFRESSLHIVLFALVWAICQREIPVARRAAWAATYCAAFFAEYFIIRRFYPATGTLILDPRDIFFGRGLWSITCIITLTVIAIVPALYLSLRKMRIGWRHNFFVLNCAATPLWIIFYRILGGNVSELRMLIPIVLPIFYGLAIDYA
jgi:hypothetical protein